LRYTFFIALIFPFYVSNAQFLEVGGGLGVSNYSGDLMRGYKITNVTPGITIHHRQNYSQFVSVKYAFTVSKVKGSDDDPIDPFAEIRAQSFEVNYLELGATFEYHFLDYRDDESLISYSPYLFGGVAFTKWNNTDSQNDFSRLQPSIPFGLGFKKLLGRNFSLDFEFGMRKTFFDYIDDISETDDFRLKDYEYGNPNDTDWYYFSSITISYIIRKIPCPFPYVPNKYMLKR
jgi:hypothetical protein